MSNNLRRILTALVAAPLLVGVAYVGGWWFAATVTAIGLGAQDELYGMAEADGAAPNRWIGFGLGVLLVAATLWPPALALAGALLVVGLVAAPFILPQLHFLLSLSSTLVGALYPTGLLGALVLLREARGPLVDSLTAFWLVLLTFFVVWATDVFAYYVGRALGRHKMAPVISPNKTWEGAIGGATAAVLITVAFKLTVLDVLAWPHALAVGLIGGVLSQIGDLTESQIKRSTGVKDASSLLPGHGGLLDRFDSMVVAAPLVYLYLRWVASLVGG